MTLGLRGCLSFCKALGSVAFFEGSACGALTCGPPTLSLMIGRAGASDSACAGGGAETTGGIGAAVPGFFTTIVGKFSGAGSAFLLAASRVF